MYFYHYYESHNGWEDGAPEPAKVSYRLKQLTSLQMEIGAAVHSAAEFAIQSARSGDEVPSLDILHNKVRNDLNKAYLESRDRAAWERTPNRRKIFHEFYYATGLSDSAIEESRQRILTCLTNLLASRSFLDAIAAPYVEARQVDEFVTFDLEGTPIYAMPDLLYRLEDQTWTVTDWKTGREDVDWEQLAVYALYVYERHGLQNTSIQARIEWLATGTADDYTFSEEELRACRDRILDSVSIMQTYLADPAVNAPRERAAFPLREDTYKCRNCKFYELDEEEIASRSSGPF